MDSTLVSSLLLSGVIGLLLGTFGGGGSLLAVPVLVFVTHLAPAAAVGTSLAMVGTTSLVASYVHYRRGQVRVATALLFGFSGILPAFLGGKLTGLVSGSVILDSFAALMLLVGVGTLMRGDQNSANVTRAPVGRRRPVVAIAAGAGLGLVTGFLGVGGGFLVVPALIALAGLDLREAIGTSLLVIAVNSAAGFVGHLGEGQLDAGLTVMLTSAAVAGALAGERVARLVSTARLRRGLGFIVIAVGITTAVAATGAAAVL
jgi:uncharacterized membrane protein YfcA